VEFYADILYCTEHLEEITFTHKNHTRESFLSKNPLCS